MRCSAALHMHVNVGVGLTMVSGRDGTALFGGRYSQRSFVVTSRPIAYTHGVVVDQLNTSLCEPNSSLLELESSRARASLQARTNLRLGSS
jgi:hypothetical protein